MALVVNRVVSTRLSEGTVDVGSRDDVLRSASCLLQSPLSTPTSVPQESHLALTAKIGDPLSQITNSFLFLLLDTIGKLELVQPPSQVSSFAPPLPTSYLDASTRHLDLFQCHTPSNPTENKDTALECEHGPVKGQEESIANKLHGQFDSHTIDCVCLFLAIEARLSTLSTHPPLEKLKRHSWI